MIAKPAAAGFAATRSVVGSGPGYFGSRAVQFVITVMPTGVGSSTVDRVDILALNQALEKLEQIDAGQSRIVELRFFGGLTVEETSAALGVSAATV